MYYLEAAGVPEAESAGVPEAEAAGVPEAEAAEVPLNKNTVITVCWTCCAL